MNTDLVAKLYHNARVGVCGAGVALISPHIQSITEVAQMIAAVAGALITIITLYRAAFLKQKK